MYRLYKHIWQLLVPAERRRVAGFVAGNTAVGLLDIGSIVCLLLVVKRYTGGQVHSLWPALGLLLLFTAKNFAGHTFFQYQVKCMTRIANRLSESNLSAYLYGPYEQYAGQDSAVFIRRILHQPTEFAQYVLLNAQQLLSESMMVLFAITALLCYNAKLLMIISVTLLPPALLLLFLTRRRLRRVKGRIKTQAERSLQYLRESLAGFVEINIFRRHDFFLRRHAATQAELGNSIAHMQITQDLPVRVFEVFAILGLFILIAAMHDAGPSYLVLLGAFMAAAYKIIPGISRIINLGSQLKAYQHSMDGLEAMPVKDLPPPFASPVISLRQVTYTYPHKIIFQDITYDFQPGCLYGISGPSGQGKTTLLNLVAGFLQPGAGSIHTPQDVAYAKQEPFLLHATVANNIVLFAENPDTCQLQRAADLAGLAFPEGLEKMIQEGGKNISGGQRQRIALARVLYKDAPVILLDEPFSELDRAAELSLLQHLRALAASGKTILLISHNPEAFQYCDVVLELSNNCIKERAVSLILKGNTGV